MASSATRHDTMEAFLDAAEQLLVTEGYAGVTVRRLADQAGANHGLVHYYFGSMEDLFLRVLERFTGRLIVRQRQMYEGDGPFIDKWRQAMRYLDEDFASGYQKIWFELQAMAWNHPEMRERVAQVNAEWREVLTETFTRALDDYALDDTRFPVAAMVSLVYTFSQGIMLERLTGVSAGHRELLAVIDRELEALEAQRGNR